MSVPYPSATSEHVIIIGGSLAGLMTALCVAQTGRPVTVLERRGPTPRTGAALRVTPGRRTGSGWSIRAVASDGSASAVQAWGDVHARLTRATTADPRITTHYHESVISVTQDGQAATVTTASGRTFTGSVVVGADGHGSIVRRAVAPTKPDSVFAGYVLWLGIIEEDVVPARYRWPEGPGEHAYLEQDGDILLGYPLAGGDGSTRPGNRRLGWAWYDKSRNDLFQREGSVDGSVVRGSLPAEKVPASVLAELRAETPRRWPHPWRDVIQEAIDRRDVIGTPVSEYVPEQLAVGRLVLVGDAAHVPSPMTGLGFDSAMDDAQSLADALDDDTSTVPERLLDYEHDRLASARQLVRQGQSFSRSFVGDRG